MLITFLTVILPWIVAAIVATGGARDSGLYVSALSPLFAAGYSAMLLGAGWSGSAAPLTDYGPMLLSIAITALLAAFLISRVEQASARLRSEWDSAS